ncbi:MAG: hypothetical protein Unbinned200contig1000_4 [Prokaryotic dsDNA virus sp.]|jgi:hypothetical protein|nr:MAG: hypothetical protein Unbinned200contig1000_4 [Prokaryotic dsDNA virus sp.]
MATNTKANTNTKAKAKAAAPAPVKATATRYQLAPTWPAKHKSGNSIRCYLYKVAAQLNAQHKGGFTVQQYATALASGLNAWVQSGGRAPSAGFGTAQKPNGNCMAHARWPVTQTYLVPVQGS